MNIASINWPSVFTAAFLTFVLGGLWYGPLFGKAWSRASGVTEAQQKNANMALVFGLSFLLQLIAAFVLDMFIGAEATLTFGTAAGAAVGVAWVATALGVTYLFEQRSLAHWAINAGYQTASFTFMGALLGSW